MKNISDIIEEFILQQFLVDEEINLSRNELANFFNCAPSQINYVLSTRFTPFRGFDTESRRGGGGYIKVYKLSSSTKKDYLSSLLNDIIGDSLDYTSAVQVLDNLREKKHITIREHNLIKSTISHAVLSSPIKIDGKLRAKIIKNVIISLIKGEH